MEKIGKNLKFLDILDEKDRKILEILQENGREKLTIVARKVGLSIDSVNKRIKKLVKKGIIARFGIFIDPKAAGFPIVADNKIKLQNITEENYQKFISYLKAHQRVIELISVSGDFDITCVIIAKDTQELDRISLDIRQKFSGLIAEWKGILVTKVHKFEEYKF